jgi:hypothetical protein
MSDRLQSARSERGDVVADIERWTLRPDGTYDGPMAEYETVAREDEDMVPGALAQRLKDERNIARQELRGAVEALEEIKRVVAIEAPPVSDGVPAKVWKLAFDALNHLGGR